MSEEEAKNAAKSRDDLQIKDYGKEELLLSPVPKISLNSIEPEQGPITGKWSFSFNDLVVDECRWNACFGERRSILKVGVYVSTPCRKYLVFCLVTSLLFLKCKFGDIIV